MARFDVYGRFTIEVERRDGAWIVWRLGADGTRARLDDVPMPAALGERDLPRHLEDVFHEYGAPGRILARLDDPAGDE